MKSFLLTLITMLLCAGAVSAQDGMNITDIRMNHREDGVTLSFELSTAKKTVKNRYTLTVTPVIASGDHKAAFPAIAIQGRNAYKTVTTTVPSTAQKILTGESAVYTAQIPYAEWMSGADLNLDIVNEGCCTVIEMSPRLLADNVLWHEPQYVTEIVRNESKPELPVSAVDKLAVQFPFLHTAEEDMEDAEGLGSVIVDGPVDRPAHIAPSAPDRATEVTGVTAVADNTDRSEPQNLPDGSREGYITIHFPQNVFTLKSDYMDNYRSLIQLISVIRVVEASETDKIARVVISGFTSPEGNREINDRLAWNRAVGLKNFMVENSTIDPSVIFLYNGSVDWQGLRELVAADDMPEKEEIIDIIDNVPVWDAANNRGRNGELMRLKGGVPYRYMTREFFPVMRQAALIKVYYEKK